MNGPMPRLRQSLPEPAGASAGIARMRHLPAALPALAMALAMALALAAFPAQAAQERGDTAQAALPGAPATSANATAVPAEPVVERPPIIAPAAPRDEVCERPPTPGTGATAAAIARTACLEHQAWFRPFIGTDGRLASHTVTEAERARLLDDTPAWQRVARYWRESGTLSSMIHIAGARSCLYPAGGREADNDCRAYIVDNPWSAAFVSWVMARTSVPGFVGSARHVDYITRAWRDPAGSPYVHANPFTAPATPGDLLCFLREGEQALGPEGFRQALDDRWRHTPQRSHCDIVVAADVDGDRTLYLVGGNVFDTVTMRKLPLDAQGRLLASEVGLPVAAASAEAVATGEPANAKGRAAKPRRSARAGRTNRAAAASTPAAVEATAAPGAAGGGSPASPAPAAAGDSATPPVAGDCRPGNPAACSFNRRDWVVLLKLKPQAELDGQAPMPAAAD